MCLDKFVWTSFLPDLIIALIGVGFAVWVYLAQKELEKDKKQEDSDNDFKYFESLYIKNYKTAIAQSKFYKEYSELVIKDAFNFYQLNICGTENLERIINKFDHNRLFHSYLNKYQNENKTNSDILVKNFMNIFAAFDFLYAEYNMVYEVYKKHLSRLSLKVEKYKEIAQEEIIRKSFIALRDIKESDKELHSKLEEILYNYRNLDRVNKTFKNTDKLLVQVLIEKLMIKKENESNDYLTDLYFTCRSASFLYYEILNDAQLMKRKMRKTTAGYLLAIRILNKHMPSNQKPPTTY